MVRAFPVFFISGPGLITKARKCLAAKRPAGQIQKKGWLGVVPIGKKREQGDRDLVPFPIWRIDYERLPNVPRIKRQADSQDQ